MQFRKVDAYHAASLCGKYTIARFNAGPESTYMVFKGSAFIESHSFQVERDEHGVELPTYPSRVEAFKLAMAACERHAEAVASE